MDVRMPDGTIVSNVPDGITQSELLSRYSKFSGAQEEAPLTAESYKAAVAKRNAASPDRSMGDVAKDTGISLLKGAISLPESFVGLADIPTGGQIGKLLEEIGYRPKESREILDTYLSEAQQAANRKVQEAQGFMPTVGAALQNPSTIATSVLESAPQMLGGAGVARGLMAAAPKLSAVAAGAIGEGLLGAGSAAEQTRGETKDKLLTAAQALAAAGSGVGTAAFGAAGGRLANKLGLDDIDTLLASGTSKGASKSVGDFAKRAIGSGISEGVFEEMPQSAQEKMWANYAVDKPLLEGVAEAAGMGAVTGFAMGVGGGGAGHLTGKLQEKRQEEIDKQTAALKTVIDEQKAAQVAQTAQPVIEEPAVAPTAVAQPEPVQDVNAPSQDREAMLKELEDQLTAIGEEPSSITMLQSPVAETQQPVAEAPVAEPVTEETPVEVKAEAPVSEQEMDPKERLRRANVSMFNAQRRLANGQITADQYDDLKRQYDAIKLRASDIAQRAKQPIVPAVEPKGEYAEAKSLDTFFANYKDDKKRLEGLPKYGQPEVKQVVAELNQAIQKVTDAINAKGYSADAIKHKVPADVRPLFNQFSTLTGGGSRLLMESERVGNNKKLASPEKLAKAIAESQADVANTYKFLGLEPEAVAPTPVAPAPVKKVAKETPLRKASYAKNPFMTFLADQGLYHVKGKPGSLKSEFSKDKQIPVSGHGFVFRASGKQLDELLPLAIQDGYLPPDATEPQLYSLVQKAIAGQKVDPVYSAQGVEDTAAKYEERMAEPAFEERAGQTDAEWHGMSEQEYADMMAREVADLSDADFADLEQAINELTDTPASNVSTRAAMEALGFTEEEIQNEERRTAAKTPEAVAEEPAKGNEPSEAAPSLELETPAEVIGTKETVAEEAAQVKNKTTREKLQEVADNLGVQVFETSDDFKSNADGYVNIPPEDKQMEGDTPPDHVFAHELGHAIMQKRGMSFRGMPQAQINKWIPGFDKIKEISRAFRPEVHKHKVPKIRRHAQKNDEIIADALGSFLLGKSTREDIQPLIDGIGLTDYDLGTTKFDRQKREDELIAYTKKDMEERAARLEKRQAEEKAEQKAADNKAKADAERDEFVLTGSDRAADEAAARGQDSFFDLARQTTAYDDETKRSPSVKRQLDKLNRDRMKGKINDTEFANQADWVLKQADEARITKPIKPRERGYLIINERLNQAVRQGNLSREGYEMVNWFIRQNESLVDDLGVSVKEQKEGGSAGQYEPMRRIMYLMKGVATETTPVHEVLHHLERMMPANVQSGIRSAWAKQMGEAAQKATTPGEKLFFNALINAHFGSGRLADMDVAPESVELYNRLMKMGMFEGPAASFSTMKLASNMIRDGIVPYQNYQFVNPSEFWAVNGTRIVQGRYDAMKGSRLAQLKNWLRELVQKMKSVFGLSSDAPVIRALDSLAKADGKFQSKDMLAKDATYSDIAVQDEMFPRKKRPAKEKEAPPSGYRNYKGGELPPAEWDNLEDSKLDTFQYKIVDKQIDTKRVIERIKGAVGDISDKFNAYIKEELYHGRTAKGIHDFLQKELLPLTKAMKAAKVTIDEFDEYLHNRHAPEYNEHINKVNPTKKELKDTGSGISNDAAAEYMKNLSADRKATFEKLAAQVDSIVKNTQDILIASGIETQETIDAWRQQFPFYVPLNRKDLDYVNQGSGVGSGYATKGGSSKRATGSLKGVIDIIENIAMQREKAIMKAEKARVGRALYGLAIKYQNPKFWLAINPDAIKNKDKLAEELIDLGLSPADAANIAKEPASATFNKKTGLVEYEVNPLLRNSDNVFPIRINGQDRFIIFNGSDPRAQRMVQSLKNLDAEQMGIAMGTIGEVTRFMASVNTQYNPVFGAWNFLRDVQGAALNLTTTDIAGEESKVLKGVFPALKSIYSDLRSQRAGKEPKGEWQELFERYQKAGGATGYKEQFSRGNDAPGIVARELGKLDRGNVRQAADAVFNWLSDYNDAMENAVRLSAFKVALDKGMSEDKAASLAKNLTVNFNRKGAASPTLQALYAFFNASVQGTKRLAETLQGPAGKKIVAGGFTIGAIQAIALAMAGYDDDEPPQFLKDKNLILPMPGGDYLIVPMPMGFNIFPGIGRLTTEYILGQAGLITGAKGLGDKALDVTSLVLDSFNPLGSGSLLQIVSPTAFDPLAAIQSNKDAFGRPISKEDRATSPTPGFMRSREGATWLSKNIAELLNYVSSPAGTKYTKGKISPTADQLDYLAGQYTGGVGREVMKAGQYAAAVVKGETEDLPSYRVPVLGKAYGETTTPSAIASKFYMNVTELAQHENEIKQRMKNKEDVREYRAEHPETRFINRVNYIENQITALNKQKKALQEKDAPAERIKKIDEQKTALMKGLNDQIKRLQQ